MKYKHYCYEWDGLEIDETWPEFVFCTCYEQTEEIRQIKEELEKVLYAPLDISQGYTVYGEEDGDTR